MRFNRQMVKEEGHLHKLFGKDYEEYAQKIARFFPRFSKIFKINIKEAFPLEYIWSTKEKLGLIGWPLLGVFLDVFQEKLVFGTADVIKTAALFSLAASVFALTMFVEYNRG